MILIIIVYGNIALTTWHDLRACVMSQTIVLSTLTWHVTRSKAAHSVMPMSTHNKERQKDTTNTKKIRLTA